jgi:hypothetical protein
MTSADGGGVETHGGGENALVKLSSNHLVSYF